MSTALETAVSRKNGLVRDTGRIAALSLPMLLSSLGTSIANVALPSLETAFETRFQYVQWVVLAYLLATTTGVVIAGRLGDLLGRKRLLMAGIVLFTTAAILAAWAQTLALLIAARAVQGLGASAMMAMSLALVDEAVVAERAGRAMGLLATSSAVGTALGPSLGGLLIAVAGWPSIFFVMVPAGVIALTMVHRRLPHSRTEARTGKARFDALGAILLAATLVAFALAMTIETQSFGAAGISLLGTALAALLLSLWWQRIAAVPLVQLGTIAKPALAAGLAMNFFVSSAIMATLVVGPFYLAGALALDAPSAGLALSAGPIAVACIGVPAGRAADRLGPGVLTVAGLTAALSGSVLLALMPSQLGLLGYIPPILILTAGYGVFQTANNLLLMRTSDPDKRGVVSGLLNLSRNLGLIAGASCMTFAFAAAIEAPSIASAPPDAIASATRFTFGIAASLILLSLALACVRTLPRFEK